jgi:hypothetical protein
MTRPILPAQSYDEALPYLRAPYQPSQVRALVINVPDNPEAPCGIALYAIGETAMDRFNLICASNWSRTFETLIEEDRSNGGKPLYYCQVRAVVVAFGVPHDDIGEGIGDSHGAAMMNARAQAWKRAAHWHGPGQCLYAAVEIILWRNNKEDELFIPKSGEDPHKRPYLKDAGQRNIRKQYAGWLTAEGEGVFGKPLDHLELYKQIARRFHGLPTGEHAPALPPAPIETQRAASTGPAAISATPEDADGGGEADAGAESTPAEAPVAAADASARTTPELVRLPMPNVPAAQATISIAESINLTADVAHRLSNLARADGQTDGLTERQESTVLNWMVLISDLNLTSAELVKAVDFLAENGTRQEARQVHFTRWLSAKAAGPNAPDVRDQPAPAAAATASRSPQDSAPDAPPADSQEPDTEPEVDETELDGQRALVRINRAMASRGYSDRSVTQLAALAVGVGPKGKVVWEEIPPDTMQVLAELLESAGSLQWTPDFLAKEVLKAHNDTHHPTPAGRFSAFAGHLIDLAESRSVEAA